ncbi:vitamin K epoxide reductase [Amycolatopsis azurea DSM 43854]|uniref:Vitamin K epoxide reductase n=2 Tax=Amycolatopsis azurea TaxID=36819 RepID=M2QR08_9PSEU|nr:vitamin K epoxide reductase [Amycolatopsis azurea DSM 43854]
MVVWAVTIAVFWYTTLHNLHKGRTVLRYHSVVLVLWYAVIAAAVLQAFWSYWKTLV